MSKRIELLICSLLLVFIIFFSVMLTNVIYFSVTSSIENRRTNIVIDSIRAQNIIEEQIWFNTMYKRLDDMDTLLKPNPEIQSIILKEKLN